MDNELNDWLAVAGDPDMSAGALAVLSAMLRAVPWWFAAESLVAPELLAADFIAPAAGVRPTPPTWAAAFEITEAGLAYLRRRGFV